MEGGALFNTGILGNDFLWWIGQIADDSTWRDNIMSGKYKNPEQIPGWGIRYKVRIIGIHDQGQVIPEDDLPWANIIYPVTAGGGQTSSWMSSNLRQGNIVFGFWMDGKDMQVPVILGVMGNNAQTALGFTIGAKETSGVTNTQPGQIAKSGYARGSVPKKGTTKEKVPDAGLITEKPTTPEIRKESAPIAPGTKTNQYGLAANRPITQTQANDIASAKLQAQEMGIEGTPEGKQLVKDKVAEGIKNRSGAAQSPTASPQPGPTSESVGSPHQLNAGDVKTEDKLKEKIVVMNPDDPVGSATKAIQTEIDNLTTKVDKFLGARKSYIDAVSGPPSQDEINKEIRQTAVKVSKFQKIIMDKIGEYQTKKLNQALTTVVAAMPSSQRYMFADQKFLNTEENVKKYNEITNKMADQMEGILKSKLNIPQLTAQADAIAASGSLFADATSASAVSGFIDLANFGGGSDESDEPSERKKSLSLDVSDTSQIRTPRVPVCYAEDVVAQGIAANKDAISEIASSQHKNYNRFLEDVKSQLDQTDQELAAAAFDKSGLGKVTGFTDEEEDDLPQGGTNYYAENGAPTTGGTGTGLRVNITVPSGGWYDNGFATIDDEGAGYYVDTADGGGVSGTGTTTGISASGGSGSGLKLNFTIASGKITGITTNTGGSNYKDGDVLTISQGSQAAINPTTYATFTIDKVRGTVSTVANGGITINEPGSGYTIGDLLIVSQQGSGQNCGIVVTQVKDPGEKKATSGPVTPGDTSGSVADSKPNIGQKLGDMLQMLGGIEGSMTQALDFKNIMANIFPFESPPNIAVSDFYTLSRGGAGQPGPELPSTKVIDDAVSKAKDIAKPISSIPFAEPGKNQPSISLISKSIGGLSSGLTRTEVNDALKKLKSKAALGEDVKGKLTKELKNFKNTYNT